MSDIKDKLIPTELNAEVKKSFISYAMAVIVNRALPDVRDGLKPVHRRIIFDMNELGMTPDKPYRKSARIVGDVLGKYHPHGDSSVYDAMVRLAQDFSIRYMLVEGQGNFGSVDGDGAAAMRYTEARLSKLSMQMIGEIDKDTVDFYPNFDASLMQPSVLPARYPNLLVNGSSGIAVGMATNIPPHNMGEVVDAVLAMIDNPDIDLDGIMEFIKGPDFPTGGIILGTSGIREAYYTGRGRIVVRARSEVETLPNGRDRIVIDELPYMVNKAKLIGKIAELVHDKRLDGIGDIRDESDRDGMRIVIELKRDAQAQVVLSYLYKHTQLQDTFGVIMLALVDGEPRVLTLKEMLFYYLKHQEDVVTRRTRFDLDKSLARAHIVEGLLKALDNIDEVVHIIRNSPDTPTAKQRLMERFEFSDKQAQAILDMRLARLTNLEADKLHGEYDDLQRSIAYYQGLLSDRAKLMQVIRTEISEVRRKFADERRTAISPLEGEIDIADLIPIDDMIVTMTHFGYVKRLSQSTYRLQNRGGKGVAALSTREEDFVEHMYVVNSHSDMLFFTDRGRVYGLKCYEIPESGRTARGTAIVNLLQLAGGEKVTQMLPIPDRDSEDYLMMATRKGMIKKTPLSDFINLRKSGLIAVNLRDEDALIGVQLTDGSREVMLATRRGKSIRFRESSVRSTGRASQGVRSIRLINNDEVVSMSAVEEDKQVLCISSHGYGKRTNVNEYRGQERGGKGVMVMNLTEKTGDLASMLMVDQDDELMIITDDGTIIRTPAGDIRECGRVTQGVRLMRVGEGSRIVDVDIAAPEDDEGIVDSVERPDAPEEEFSENNEPDEL
ncbi:MAG: DNA gyrase subunit A [Eubacteriales bacterium]|jgi:DNA gyrase subunit A|nr:DNA gyrase subunit A [Eubacteriales bacterium]MDD4105788.1 DNA gyrase subunit A [Eubacteriales bacterium]MDD4711035.1 DNA gyrase subunit A [Eubacteriales bacterium]NLO16131.1 DNA gyrase subunit A [Clostridiales bacterium]